MGLQQSYNRVTLKRNPRALYLRALWAGYISYVTIGQNKNIAHNNPLYTIYNNIIFLIYLM